MEHRFNFLVHVHDVLKNRLESGYTFATTMESAVGKIRRKYDIMLDCIISVEHDRADVSTLYVGEI